jgi:hypothetical protein
MRHIHAEPGRGIRHGERALGGEAAGQQGQAGDGLAEGAGAARLESARSRSGQSRGAVHRDCANPGGLPSAAPTVQAADEGGNYTVALNPGSFFGLYPSFNGLFTLNDSTDFSFYGILWTRPGLSLVSTSGADLWTEFGAGVNIKLMGGALLIKPQFGVTNGSLLSGGANAALDFLHYCASAGYKVNKNFSVGGHFEHFRNTRDTYPGEDEEDTCRWLGVYTQFTLPKGLAARFSFGDDISANSGNFYKLNVAMSF